MIKDLYGVPEFENLDDCFLRGEAVGDQGFCRGINPYLKETPRHEWWDAGWSNSYDQLCGG